MISREYITEILLDDLWAFYTDLEESDIPVENEIRDLTLLELAVNAPFKTFRGHIS